jgi:thiol-disulfide isomerase/thioredoxin
LLQERLVEPIKSLVAAAVALLAAAAPGVPQTRQAPATVITGTLLGADGAPMRAAIVHLYRPNAPDRSARTPASADGRYAIATPDSGAFDIKFTGVEHYAKVVPLILGPGERIVLDVRLKHFTYRASFDSVTAVGDFTRFRSDSGLPLVRQPDGRYRLEVDASADTVAYQLRHVESERDIGSSGTQEAKGYSYRYGSGYYAVIPAQGGKGTITFDPATLSQAPGEESVAFGDTSSRAARLSLMLTRFNTRMSSFFDSAQAVRARHDSLHYDWAPIIAALRATLHGARDPLTRQVTLLELSMATSFAGTRDTSVARQFLAEFPPGSPVYSVDPNALNETFNAYRTLYGSKADPRAPLDTTVRRRMLTHLERIADAQADSFVQMSALLNAAYTARDLHDQVRMNADYERLVTNYGDASLVRYAKSMFASNRVLRVGAQIPDFTFAALDDSTVRYTKESMMGKTYLLDFWATTCGPCVMEMKYLQAAHDSLGPVGLEMLSVSIDNSAADVRRFRAGEWKMPWLNAFAPGGWENPEVKKMEILGIPRAALVGKDGRILAVDDQLRGDSLIPTIRRALQTATIP